MEEQSKTIFNQLRPVEKLYLLSKEKPEIYSKKRRAMSIISFLLKNKTLKLSHSGHKFKVNSAGTYPINEYERLFIEHIQEKNFIELDKFINNLKFDKTLIEYGILMEKIKKSKFLFFFSKAQVELTKTQTYFEIQAELARNPNESLPSIDIRVTNFYKLLKGKIIESIRKAKEEKQNSNEKANKEILKLGGIE